jgi:hypothetical protein
VALLLDLLGGAVLLSGRGSSLALAMALLLLLVSLRFLGRAFKARAQSAGAPTGGGESATKTGRRRRRAVWWLAAASLVVVGTSYLLIYVEGWLGGGRFWPLYTFAAVVVVCCLAWSCYLFLFLGYPWGGTRGRR